MLYSMPRTAMVMLNIALDVEKMIEFTRNSKGHFAPIENSEILRMMRGKKPKTKRHAAVLDEALKRLENALPADQYPPDAIRRRKSLH